MSLRMLRRLLAPVAALLLVPGLARAVTTTAPRVVQSFAHDPKAFTQGLLLHRGSFFESTGLLERSTLREVVPETGEVLRRLELPADEFGEGIARVGDVIWMLTWKNGVAHQFALDDFAALRDVSYEGEGWGLCFDGQRLVMSDGSSSLQFRDPESFELLGRQEITRDGSPIANLNELECVGQDVYANVWQTDLVLQIDPQSGEVLSQIDASDLLSAVDAVGADVLNGIAYDADCGHFFLAGKLWPKVFEVEFAADSAPRSMPLATEPDAGFPTPALDAPSGASRSNGAAGCAVDRTGYAGHTWSFGFFAALLVAARRVRGWPQLLGSVDRLPWWIRTRARQGSRPLPPT